MDDDSDDAMYGLVPGSRVGAYLLEELIGRGGMAFVFRALDERLGRRVALKIMDPEYAADKLLRARFKREPKAASAVDHPHIIPVYEAGEADGYLYIAMRYVEGGDVRSLLRSGALTIDRVVGIVSPVASALDAVHEIGLVHRDVKPENMLLDVGQERPDHVYLSDWGISKGAFRLWPGTDPGMFLGTVAYVAPEQAQGEPVDGRTDQYALGCATFEMLCGEPPFPSNNQHETLVAHMKEMAPAVTSRQPALPVGLDLVFARVLSKKPGDRYGSCGEFSAALREAASAPPYYLHTPPSPPGNEKVRFYVPTVVEAAETIDAPRTAPEASLEAAARVSRPAVLREGSLSDRPSPPWLSRRAILVMAAALVLAVLVTVITFSLGADHSSARLPRPTRFALSPLPGRTLALSRRGFIPESAAFNPDGTTIAVATTVPGGGGGKTFLWSLVTGTCTPLLDPRSQGVQAVAFSPNGALLAAADADGSTYLWSPATRTIAAILRDPRDQDENAVNAVAFSPDGVILAAGDNDGSTYLWNTATHTVTATLTDPQTSEVVQSGPDVQAIAFSPDGDTLATGDTDGYAYLWDVATGTRATTLADPYLEGVEALAFSPDGDRLAVGDADGSTYLWNPAIRAIACHAPRPTRDTRCEFGGLQPEGHHSGYW